ncbi:glycosyltransferase family 4 protein [Gammaproteobacteria bacterium]|nr:glycosyltransferase family 4 protein [Gammaproteobacteria bacterium]
MQTGTAFYTRNLALALQHYGHEVEVVTLGSPSLSQEDRLTVHRLPAFTMPLAGFFKHFRLCAWNPFNWWRFSKIAKTSKAEVILLVNHYLDIAFLSRFAAGKNRIPLVCSVGTQLQSLNPRRNKILNFLDRLFCGFLVFPGCTRIVAWDTQIRQYLQDVQGNNILRKVVIVNYGVNGDPSSLLARQHNYNNDEVILGVGAVSEQRSFVPLVKAFAQLAPNYPKLRLRIIGHVYYGEAPRLVAELGLSDRVEFYGELPHDQVIEHMQQATMFYSSLTGQYVGLGTATIEAMLLGLPTVVNTPLDLLGTGVMVDKEDLVQCTSVEPEKIAERLNLLLSDFELRQRVGQGGRNFVQRYLNWDVVAQDMVLVLQQAVEHRG